MLLILTITSQYFSTLMLGQDGIREFCVLYGSCFTLNMTPAAGAKG